MAKLYDLTVVLFNIQITLQRNISFPVCYLKLPQCTQLTLGWLGFYSILSMQVAVIYHALYRYHINLHGEHKICNHSFIT